MKGSVGAIGREKDPAYLITIGLIRFVISGGGYPPAGRLMSNRINIYLRVAGRIVKAWLRGVYGPVRGMPGGRTIDLASVLAQGIR